MVALSKNLTAVILLASHVKWVTCYHSMAHPQVTGGGDGLQLRKVGANILNKQPQMTRGGPPACGLDMELTNPPPYKTSMFKMSQSSRTWKQHIKILFIMK
jgi:hypothetical protein